MSTPAEKLSKTSLLNTKLLPVAALILVVLALLFMATPLLRTARGAARNGNFAVRTGDQTTSQNGLPTQGGGTGTQSLPGQSGSTVPNRQFAFRGGGFLAGVTGAVVFFLALLVSLVAAVGMLFTRRWGQVLGIIMAVLYGLVGLIALVPVVLLSSIGLRNPFSLVLGIVHVLLAVSVIVLAAIPARKPLALAGADLPPAAGM